MDGGSGRDPVMDRFDTVRQTVYNGGTMDQKGGRTLDAAVALSIAALAVVSRVVILRATHSTTEDFYITLRYAENLARGEGFVYNPGERVLGTTTPLYTLLLALAAALHADATAVGKGLNILAEGTTCALMVFLLAAIGRPRVGWLAALLYATASAPVNFSIGGMETALVTLAGLSAIYAFVRGQLRAMWLALATLFLLRIDGLLLAAVLGFSVFDSGFWIAERPHPDPESRIQNRTSLHGLILAALIVLPWLVFATLYFGSPIPTSLTAKLAVYQRTRAETLPNLGDFYHQFLGGWPQRALFAAFLVGVVSSWRDYHRLRAPLVWLALYHAAMLCSKVPAFGWYFVPPLPLYYICVAVGLAQVAFWILDFRFRIARSKIQNLALLMLAIPLVWHLRNVARDIATAQQLEDTVRKPLGLWLAQNSAPDERVMLEPIGYIGYFSRRPVLDIIGLVSPEVLPFYRREVANPLGAIAAQFRPDWLVLRKEERTQLADYRIGPGRSLLDDYAFVLAFPDPKTGPAFFVYRRR